MKQLIPITLHIIIPETLMRQLDIPVPFPRMPKPQTLSTTNHIAVLRSGMVKLVNSLVDLVCACLCVAAGPGGVVLDFHVVDDLCDF
ncbi:hypothetical protein BDW69DRAFT_6277 [Aspergillus filifer]